jgi:ergothioneine biosynthesis protein EgtB
MNAHALGTDRVSSLAERFARSRATTEYLCRPLATEDFVVQSMPDASPIRWHLAHTTWFFDTFVLARWESGYQPVQPAYQVLFNSYYQSVGEQFPRARRGLLTRPTVSDVFDYRHAVDQRVSRILAHHGGDAADGLHDVVELGIHHEQQHQELMLTDLKHAFSCNPLFPTYRQDASAPVRPASRTRDRGDHRQHFAGGVVDIGHADPSFCFDNERPRHAVYLQPYNLETQLVTNGQYRAFIEDGGYRRPELWLSLGWTTVQEQQWSAPLYWFERDGQWFEFTLGGLRPLDVDAPACHVSYFEAEAFARWAGGRLPTEAEWEHAAAAAPVAGSFLESERYHPRAAASSDDPQWYGEVWQWTASPYTPYPGYQPPPGALGEYNGKFMCNQYVLRGGSCATPASHIRPSYRNFFPPDARWQFSGIRLADG